MGEASQFGSDVFYSMDYDQSGGLSADLAKQGVGKTRIHTEAFEFR